MSEATKIGPEWTFNGVYWDGRRRTVGRWVAIWSNHPRVIHEELPPFAADYGEKEKAEAFAEANRPVWNPRMPAR